MSEIEKAAPDSSLAGRHCAPCRRGTAPLDTESMRKLLAQIQGWKVVDGHHLWKAWKFSDFQSALAFVNRVGEAAESEGHHPDIVLGWGKAEITLWTHAAGGLTENDFILAAKIDHL